MRATCLQVDNASNQPASHHNCATPSRCIPSNDGLRGAIRSGDELGNTASFPFEEGAELGVLASELPAGEELYQAEFELELDGKRLCCLCGIGTEEDAMVCC